MEVSPGLGYEPVADGEIAALVTFLEMRERPATAIPESDLSLEAISPTPDEYRRLFRQVGARWLWFSRLLRDNSDLSAIIGHPAVEIFVVKDAGGEEVGFVELDFREEGECELAFIGLVPKLAGSGHGRWLLSRTLAEAWREGVHRVHVHTCSLDHPAALSAYVRAGFIPYKRAIERFTDPRILGILPADCAPQLPLLAPARPAS
jgi:GNAT superfamily N-acetyltransferase